MISEVLKKLGELQTVADEIDRLEAMRSEAQDEKLRVLAALEAAQKECAVREENARHLDIERRKRELVLIEEKERHQRIKSRLGEVKNSREYQAVLGETSTVKHAINEQEEAILKDMEAFEAASAELDVAKEKVERIKNDYAETEMKVAAVDAETEASITENKGMEVRILGDLPNDVVDRYRMIRDRRGGTAVVEARGEACTACYMRIPPQTYIEVMRGTSVVQCPNCHRILIPCEEGDETKETV